jgi:hypothetical protein
MQITRNRISKLEQRMAPPLPTGKYIVVRGGTSDDEVSDLLRENGIDANNPAHTIVHLQRLIVDRSGTDSLLNSKAEILYIRDNR